MQENESMSRKIPIGFRVDPEQKARVDEAAAKERRSVASLYELAMDAYLEKHHPLEVKKGKSK
jgi:uncharacterized protein (DUF1778 family)